MTHKEYRRIREQERKLRAVMAHIDDEGGITDQQLMTRYGFIRIGIKKQAERAGILVDSVRDSDGNLRYSRRPPPAWR